MVSRRIAYWLIIMLVCTSSTVTAAMRSAVDSINVSEIDGGKQVQIVFSCSIRYLDHYPPEKADFLQINLLQTEQCSSLDLPAGRQEIAIPGSASAALASVEYELRQGGEAVLLLRFDHSVNARVSQFGDQRKLGIVLVNNQPDDTYLPYNSRSSALSAIVTRDVTGGPAGVATGDRPLSDTELESLMGQAEAAILEQNYDRSIQINTRILRAEETDHTPQALELLALSRERKGQEAHAVAEYRRYLDHYPDSEGADRVSQRLAGLVTAHKTPKSARADGPVKTKTSPWNTYGGISQYYRQDTFKLDGRESVTAQSSILTNADIIMRRRGKRIDFSFRASLGNLWDLLGEDRGPGSQTRLYQGYAEVIDKVTGLSGRLGRQTLRSSGVLGRFDGLHLGWEFLPGRRLNLMGGYPVATTADGIETGRNFLGAAIDIEQVLDLFDISFFYNVQKYEGLENRKAVGTQFRYFDQSKSLIALVDYDIGFNTLNNLVLTGNWNITNSSTISASVDYRTSPFLTARNALIGQPVSSFDELLLIYSADEIRQLAKDRTGSAKALRLGASHSLSERFQINADFSMTGFEGTVASGGVAEIPDQDTQYYFALNLLGSKLFMDGDSSILGLRYISGMTSSTSTLSLDSRFPLGTKFRLNPRVRVSHRDNKIDGSESWILFPSMRLLYRIGRRYRLDFDAGGVWTKRDTQDAMGDRKSWYLYFGYRADF